MLSKLNELGMMTSEYVYIVPVINIDLSRFYLTPWVDVSTYNFKLIPEWKPFWINVKMVSYSCHNRSTQEGESILIFLIYLAGLQLGNYHLHVHVVFKR